MRRTAMMVTDCRGPKACGSDLWARATILLLALIFTFLLGSTPLQAQSDGENSLRIGFVDMVRLFDNAPQLVAAREALDIEFRPRYDALNSDEARIESLTARMMAISDPASESQRDLDREIRNLQRSVDRRREDLTQEIRFRTNAEKNAIEDTIQIAIRQVAEQGGFDLVLTGPVAFASERVDMTNQVIEWLEQDHSSDTDTPGSVP